MIFFYMRFCYLIHKDPGKYEQFSRVDTMSKYSICSNYERIAAIIIMFYDIKENIPVMKESLRSLSTKIEHV